MTETAKRLSGVWDGTSTSQNNDPTRWVDTHIEFIPDSTGVRGSLRGAGVSLWRQMQISFDVAGSFDLETNTINIIKQHKGRYNNTVEYAGVILTDSMSIAGTYKNGVINLSRRPTSRSILSPTCLSGKWEGESISRNNDPTKWTETLLSFRIGSDGESGTVEGTGLSIWRDLSIDFDVHGEFNWASRKISLSKRHKGQYTNVVEYIGTIDPSSGRIEGSYSNGTITLNLEDDTTHPRHVTTDAAVLNSGTREEDESYELAESERHAREDTARRRAAEARSVQHTLNGVWEGQSIDCEGNATGWSDTALRFQLDPRTGKGDITGRGVSKWRDQLIDFSVKGTFDWESHTLVMTKQHSGRYTNKIDYAAKIKLPVGMSNAMPIIKGSYAKGEIILRKVRDSLGTAARSIFDRNSLGRQREEKTGDEELGASILTQGDRGNSPPHIEEKDAAAAVNRDRVSDYRMFLSGVCADGTISSREQEILAKYRNAHDVTDEEHRRALDELGISQGDFSMLADEDSGGENEDDLCKICFVAKINTVVLPCGHFAMCLSCGRELRKCPICRTPIHKVQQIFRA